MASKKLVVVFGATGAQGGSVVKSILGDAKAAAQFSIRGITRDVSKPSAQALVANGAEMVSANMDDPKSVKAALKGAYAAYAVTNFWETMNEEVELAQGKNVADAAKENGVEHLVWSSLINVKELTKGVLSGVHHFDSKARVEAYIRSIDIPATFFMPGFYMSNLPGNMIRQDPTTKDYVFSLPIPADSPIPLLDTEDDTGKFVKAILLKPTATIGKRVYGSSGYVTPTQIIKDFQEIYPEAGKGAKYVEISASDYKSGLAKVGMPEIAQEDLLENMLLMPQFGYYGGDSLEESQSIVDEPLVTWKEYAAKSKKWADLK